VLTGPSLPVPRLMSITGIWTLIGVIGVYITKVLTYPPGA
jgi:hypothetical protein